jgi:hypothetical protein
MLGAGVSLTTLLGLRDCPAPTLLSPPPPLSPEVPALSPPPAAVSGACPAAVLTATSAAAAFTGAAAPCGSPGALCGACLTALATPFVLTGGVDASDVTALTACITAQASYMLAAGVSAAALGSLSSCADGAAVPAPAPAPAQEACPADALSETASAALFADAATVCGSATSDAVCGACLVAVVTPFVSLGGVNPGDSALLAACVAGQAALIGAAGVPSAVLLGLGSCVTDSVVSTRVTLGGFTAATFDAAAQAAFVQGLASLLPPDAGVSADDVQVTSVADADAARRRGLRTAGVDVGVAVAVDSAAALDALSTGIATLSANPSALSAALAAAGLTGAIVSGIGAPVVAAAFASLMPSPPPPPRPPPPPPAVCPSTILAATSSAYSAFLPAAKACSYWACASLLSDARGSCLEPRCAACAQALALPFVLAGVSYDDAPTLAACIRSSSDVIEYSGIASFSQEERFAGTWAQGPLVSLCDLPALLQGMPATDAAPPSLLPPPAPPRPPLPPPSPPSLLPSIDTCASLSSAALLCAAGPSVQCCTALGASVGSTYGGATANCLCVRPVWSKVSALLPTMAATVLACAAAPYNVDDVSYFGQSGGLCPSASAGGPSAWEALDTTAGTIELMSAQLLTGAPLMVPPNTVLTISGNLAACGGRCVVDADTLSQVLLVGADATVTLVNLELVNGAAAADNGNTAAANGGAIQGAAGSNITLQNVVVASSSAANDGGCVWTAGQLNVVGTLIQACTANGNGGGVKAAGPLYISSSIIRDCVVVGYGGAVMATGGLQMDASVVVSNTATTLGAGIYNVFYRALITNSVIRLGATMGGGGAVYSSGPVTISDSAIDSNDGGAAGGGMLVIAPATTFSAMRTLFTDNFASDTGAPALLRSRAVLLSACMARADASACLSLRRRQEARCSCR